MPIVQMKHVRHPGAWLEEQYQDHERTTNSENQGGARQEPRHPPARCPETRQKKENANKNHDPKLE